ncbi:MAG: protease inhibitor I42 family protein [Burkholderiaceae bacterium]
MKKFPQCRARWVAAVIAATGLALLGGCSAPRPARAETASAPTMIQVPGQPVITIADDQSGASIVLERAQELVVRLPIERTTPYRWSLVDLKPGVLTAEESEFQGAQVNDVLNDRSGVKVWRFRPLVAGTVVLTFDLRQPRRLDPAVRTVTYTVTVR